MTRWSGNPAESESWVEHDRTNLILDVGHDWGNDFRGWCRLIFSKSCIPAQRWLFAMRTCLHEEVRGVAAHSSAWHIPTGYMRVLEVLWGERGLWAVGCGGLRLGLGSQGLRPVYLISPVLVLPLLRLQKFPHIVQYISQFFSDGQLRVLAVSWLLKTFNRPLLAADTKPFTCCPPSAWSHDPGLGRSRHVWCDIWTPFVDDSIVNTSRRCSIIPILTTIPLHHPLETRDSSYKEIKVSLAISMNSCSSP